MKRTIIIITAVLFLAGTLVVPGFGKSRKGYKAFTLEPLPDWTDKYAATNKGDRSYFKMSKLVKELGLTWLQAVELQNHFRDLTVAGTSSKKAFKKALKKVRNNEFESGIDPAKMAAAKFIVVIDLDDTLLQQYYNKWKDGPEYYDYKITFGDGRTRGISMVPGWELLIETIKKSGGAVVLFSANVDDVVWKIVRTVSSGDKKLYQMVDGVMTNNYLILQGKREWMPEGRVGTPVIKPSKDLRCLDKSLSKIIIIDDNPTRIVQSHRLRLPKKYDTDFYHFNKFAARALYKQIPEIAWEIEEAAEYSEKNGISFARSYLPYTQLGRVALDCLMETFTFSRKEAIDFVRKTPGIVDRNF